MYVFARCMHTDCKTISNNIVNSESIKKKIVYSPNKNIDTTSNQNVDPGIGFHFRVQHQQFNPERIDPEFVNSKQTIVYVLKCNNCPSKSESKG